MTTVGHQFSYDASPPARIANRRDEGDFRVARRHSIAVSILRKLLPAIAVISSLSFVALAAVSYVPIGDLSVGGASLKDGRLVMETPKMAGFDSKNRPYDVKALRALQDLTNPEVIELEKIDANLPMDEKTHAKLTADEGTYNTEAEKLQLRKNVIIKGARGMDIDLQSADIDIRTGAMKSNEPVKVVSDKSKVLAESVEVEDNGKRIVFRNNVRVTIVKPVERGTPSSDSKSKKGDISQ